MTESAATGAARVVQKESEMSASTRKVRVHAVRPVPSAHSTLASLDANIESVLRKISARSARGLASTVLLARLDDLNAERVRFVQIVASEANDRSVQAARNVVRNGGRKVSQTTATPTVSVSPAPSVPSLPKAWAVKLHGQNTVVRFATFAEANALSRSNVTSRPFLQVKINNRWVNAQA